MRPILMLVFLAGLVAGSSCTETGANRGARGSKASPSRGVGSS